MTSVLVSYAIEHLFLSGLLLAVAAAVVRWVPAHARHPWLLGALVVAVAGPLLPLAAMLPGDAPTHLSSASALPRVAGGDIGLPSAWAAALLAVWASIGLVRMCRLAKAWRSAGVVARLSHRSLEIERQHADVLHRGTRVHLSPCFGPAVLGVLNPCIVLPARVAAQLPYEAMRAVIAHESEHIARRDPAWHALERASLALFWWNPAMAQLARWLDQARELACDAGAARRAGNRVQYAEALLCVAVHARGAPPKPALAALAMASGTPLLEHRIDALLQPGHHRRGTRSAVGCLLALAMLSAWAAASTAAPDVRMPTTDLRADEAELPTLTASARFAYQRIAEPAHYEYERLSQSAQSRYERLSRSARSRYERLSESAQSRYERASQSAQSEYERRSEGAQRDFERSMAAAHRVYSQAQDFAQ